MGYNFRVGLLLLTFAGLYCLSEASESDNYPGVIELVGYSNRRARTYYAPTEDKPTAAPAAAKMQADIETVKQNIEKYNKLLTLDTKNLPESQKDMLERIVERVARLKESLDIAEPVKEKTNATKSSDTQEDKSEPKELNEEEEENSTLTPTSMPTRFEELEEEDKTEPTLVLDETTLLQLQTSMDKLAAAQAAVTSQATQMREFPTTTEMMPEENLDEEEQQTTESPESEEEYEGTTFEPSTDTTDPAEQFVAARSNNNLAGITAASDEAETMATLSTTVGSQRTLTTSGKITKNRATKRPHAANKNNNAKRRPSTSSASYNKNSNTKQKIPSGVTQPSLQQYQKISQKPQPLTNQYQQPSVQQYGHLPQPSLQQGYQSQPPKTVSPSSISLDKYNTGSSSSAAPANIAASYGINPASVSAPATSLPVNSYGSPSSSSSSSLSSAASSASQDLVYDSHVNTSAIIDSLNNNAREEYYQQKQSLTTGVVTKDKKPVTGAKPTKYHYYPHNQHIYLLPECAIQQVCNAVYVRLNYTQPLCACPSRYRDPCSASLNEDDQHTTKLVGDGKKK
ncbi:histone acetyltransferase KAT6A, partial [Lucilia sericata]|uniref:histone acetyltransferase KAT6A n=1 Tax=Lucilia sericata TaxID=13632 RepID=UPI0018A8211F